MEKSEVKQPYVSPTIEDLGGIAEMTLGRKVFAPLDGVVFSETLVGQS